MDDEPTILMTDEEPPVTAAQRAWWILREILETLLLAAVVFFLLRVVVQNFRVDGHSMEPNLHDGQYLIVDRVSYFLREPRRGEVIVFHAPPSPGEDFVKRVIGLPGETVEVRRGTVYIDGVELEEPYVPYAGSRSWGPAVVGEGELFVMGDNRPSSNDSRQWGYLPEEEVIGRALLCYWPPADWGLIEHAEAE